jgi:hypothetical protein
VNQRSAHPQQKKQICYSALRARHARGGLRVARLQRRLRKQRVEVTQDRQGLVEPKAIARERRDSGERVAA